MHHWAHNASRNCDPWWENETAWHREWKSHFPEECREVSHTAPDGEIHRADIKTPTGIVIEVQHSTMTDRERESREKFYENLVWIVDGRSFRRNFYVGWKLPDPAAHGFEDIVWFPQLRETFRNHLASTDRVPFFWRISVAREHYPGVTRENLGAVTGLVRHGDPEGIRDLVEANYTGHHQFDWVRPRRTWFDAECPVYIDFGEELLYELVDYDETIDVCVRLVSKRKLIHDAMVEDRAEDIATRFYPMS